MDRPHHSSPHLPHSPFPSPGADLKSEPNETPGVPAPSLSLFPEKPKLRCCLFPVLLAQRKDLLTNYITGAPWHQHHPRETPQKMWGGGRGDGWKYSQHTSSLSSLPRTGPLGRGFTSPGFQLLSRLPAPHSSDFPFVFPAFKVV